jgi:8-oxo-dGTP diphosphatase
MRLVVGVALLREGRVLAARRTHPAEVAGGWELPGGKADPGEEPGAAAVREIAEELGCTVVVTGWLAPTVPISHSLELRACTAELVAGEPLPHEHDAVRWLGADELDEVAWLPADVPFVTELREVLGR